MQTNSWEIALRFSLLALSWWQCSTSKLFSLGWPIVAGNVFSRRMAEINYVQLWLMHHQQIPCQTPDSRSVSLMRDFFQVTPLLCPSA